MPAVALTEKASYAPVIWMPFLLAYWLLIYALWFVTVLFRLLIYAATLLLLLGWTVPLLAGIGGLLLPITASQDAFFQAATDLGQTVEGIIIDLKDLIDELLHCKEIIVELWNNWMRFFASVIKRIFQAVNNFLGLGLPPIFDWAERAIKMERAMQKLELQEEVRDMLMKYEYEITNRTSTIEPRYRAMYLQMMKHKLFKIAKAHTIGRSLADQRRSAVSVLRITLLPQQLCDILEGLFEFLLGLLDIFADFFLAFLDALLDIFDIGNGQFDESFLFALVKFLVIEILVQIPFTGCFVDPDDLAGLSAEDILPLMLQQTPSRLISCLCPWRYANPFGFICFLASNPPPQCDTVPSNPGAALVGCLCFNPNVEIDSGAEPFDLLIKCLGIDILIELFNSFVNYLETVVLVIIDSLQSVYQGLLSTVNALENAYNDLFDLFKDLEDLVRSDGPFLPDGVTRDMLTPEIVRAIDERTAQLRANAQEAQNRWDEWRATFKSILESQRIRDDLIREIHQQLTNKTYIDYMHAQPQYERWSKILSPTSTAALGLLYRMRMQAQNLTNYERSIREETKATIGQNFARMMNELPKSEWFSGLEQKLSKRFNEETTGIDSRAEIQTLIGSLRGLFQVGSWAVSTKTTMTEVAEKIDREVDIDGLVSSVFRLSRARRNIRVDAETGDAEHEALQAARVAMKVWARSAFDPEALPRTVRELEKRYGKKSETMVRGIRMASRVLPKAAVERNLNEQTLKKQTLNKRASEGGTRLMDIMEEYGLRWEDVQKVEKETKQKAKRLEKENKARAEDLFDPVRHAKVKYEKFLDFATMSYVRYSEQFEDRPATRVIAIGVTVTAGAAASFVSVAGFFIGAGLSVLGTLIVGILGPLLVIVVVFIGTVIQFIVQIAVGLIFNTFRDDDTRPVFDFFTPYIIALTDLVADSFTNGYNLPDLLSAVDDIGEITVDNLEYTLAYFIRDRLCAIPLRLPPYTCPREPLVDEDGRPDESIVDYILNAILYFPQDDYCLDSDDCGGGDCVCAGFPSRLGTYNAPCTTPANENYCNGWPLIQERIGLNDYEIDIELDPQCEEVLDLPIKRLAYYEGDVFKEEGFSFAWYTSSEFFDFLLAILQTGYIILRFLVQRLILGGFLRWSGAFVGIGGVLWFVPSPILSAIALATLLGNTLTTFLNERGADIIDFAEARTDAAILGPLYEELLLWLRFPNYADDPPFGFARTVDWVCIVAAIPAGLIATSAFLPIVAIFLGLLLSGFFLWFFFFFFDIILFPLNWLLLLGRILMVNGLLYRRGVMRNALLNGWVNASAAEGARRFGNTPETYYGNTGETNGKRSPFFSEGQVPSSSRFSGMPGRRAVARSTFVGKQPWHRNYLRIGDDAHVRGAHPLNVVNEHRPLSKRTVQAGNYTLYNKRAHMSAEHQELVPWPKAIGMALHSTIMAIPSFFTLQGVRDVSRSGPVNLRRFLGYEYDNTKIGSEASVEKNPLRHEFVVLDEHVAHEHHSGFPLTAYLINGNGLSILHDENVAVVHTDCLHRCMDDEHSARYLHL